MSSEFTWWSPDGLLSRGAMINIAVGARGLGKTYACKRIAIRRAIESGEEFIYLRRFKTELKRITTFFDDIRDEFEGHELTVKGRSAVIDGEVRGHFVALTEAPTLKSVSYPRVTTMLFDEFIIENSTRHYLQNEVDMFLDFYSTVDRNQDRVRVFMLSNAVRMVNPYFVEWRLHGSSGFQRRGGGYLCCEVIDNDAFAEEVGSTRFGRFIHEMSPEYAEYAVDNRFSDDTTDLLGSKSPKAVCKFVMRTRIGSFSCWEDEAHEWFVQERIPRGENRRLCYKVRPNDGETVVERGSPEIIYLRFALMRGNLHFDKIRTRETFWSVMI